MAKAEVEEKATGIQVKAKELKARGKATKEAAPGIAPKAVGSVPGSWLLFNSK